MLPEMVKKGIKLNMEEMQLKLVSPIPPSVNHYLAYRVVTKNKRPMAMSYKTTEAKKYQAYMIDYVKQEVEKQNWIMSDNKSQHYYMDVIFYFPRADMDANNYFKCLADAITDTQSVWIDDTQLCERVQGIFYDTENPRLEITIKPVSYIGVFQTKEIYEKFCSKCETCQRFKRNCSLLKKAKEGKISLEIQNDICSKYKTKKD